MTYEIQVLIVPGTWKTVAQRANKTVAQHYAFIAARQHQRLYRVIAKEPGSLDDRHLLDGVREG